MKRMHQLLALILSVCVLTAMLMPALGSMMALGAEERYSWVLDTDGIEAGEEYLIVSGTAANSTALKRDGNNIAAQAVVVKDGNTIDKFDGDENCSFVFSNGTSGTSATSNTIKIGDRYLNISTGSISYNTSSQNVNVRRYTAGYYRIYATVSWSSRYVRYYRNSWSAATSTSNANLYLYKKVLLPDPTYTVTYDGNGATSGDLPANQSDLYHGDSHTVGAPTDLVKYDAANDDTYLFHCWNTTSDGTGVDYMPGGQLTMGNADITLYAKWYLQPKYTITVRCNVDGQPHDIPHNHEGDVYVSRDGITYLPLTKTETGVYTTTVTENGDYVVYFGHDGHYESAHGHQVVIYNQNGETTLQNFTITYEKGYDGEVAAGDTDTWQEIYHAYTTIFATEEIPVRAGYAFRGWVDSEGNPMAGGTTLTTSHSAPIVLTATWEKLTDVQVEITLNHNAPNGGFNNTTDKNEVQLQLLQLIDGVYQPVGESVILDDTTHYDAEANITRYVYTFEDLPQGEYSISSSKQGYEETLTVDENGVIHLTHTYAPDSFDLYFTVQTTPGAPAALRPTAVNIRVLCWSYNENGTLGWNIITQHGDGNPPVTVTLDANGNGSAFYTVWKDWVDYDHPYIYRLMVSSFVMPDGSVVMADSKDYILYTPNGSGLYTATMVVTDGNILPDGIVPAPELDGAYYDGTQQQGALKVVLDVNPLTVTFDPVEGNVNGESLITLTNQFAYPDLNRYLPTREGKIFDGWYLDAAYTIPATNQYGSYLTGDVTYYAKWRDPLTLSGTIQVEGAYLQNGEKVSIPEQDRATEAVVLLLKETDGAYNVVDFCTVTFPKNYGDLGSANYEFTISDENATYRIEVLELNYTSTYDNNGDDAFASNEYIVLPNDGNAVVDVYLAFEPESYVQTVTVDATQISQNYRPTGALVAIDYRDLGTYGDWNIISQHTQAPYGVNVTLEKNGIGANGYAVWNWHTDGALYEYQAELSKLYGHVPGVYEREGTAYSNDLPYTIHYGASAWYNHTLGQQSGTTTVTLEPKQYEVVFDLGFTSSDIVSGMEHLITVGPNGDYYAYRHTWSYGETFIAYPFREGYIFKGWQSDNEGVLIHNNGEITVATGLMENVTLTAQWEKVEGTAYIVRYLEKNTNKVLRGSKMVQGVAVGGTVYAADEAEGVEIPGYICDSADPQVLTITNNNQLNTMILYYLPDGSDGYTEQVESNLHLDKDAILEDNGTYTVWMETFTTDNPVTTLIQQNTPLDIVLVLDQSASMYNMFNGGSLPKLKDAVGNFITLIADHGRENKVDHRIAMVGYGCDGSIAGFGSGYPTANGNTGVWCNTGVFDSHGIFHNYPVTGFDYTPYTGSISKTGVYYTLSGDDYLLLTYHEMYNHLITETEARAALLQGQTVYGYIHNEQGEGNYVALSRNSSGLWLYGDRQLYSEKEFFTRHADVWTHRNGTDRREIHAYGTEGNYAPVDGHDNVYTRTETKVADPEQSIYTDALVPVTTGQNGAGNVTPGLLTATDSIGANGRTYVSYGMKMANSILAANPVSDAEGRLRIVVVFTDGKPGDSSNFDENESNAALTAAYETTHTHGAHIYTIGLYGNDTVAPESDQDYFMNGLSSNYPDAQTMDDVWQTVEYRPTQSGYTLDNGGPYFVNDNGTYRQISKKMVYANRQYNYTWGFNDADGNRIDIHSVTTNTPPTIVDNQVNGYTIYRRYGADYRPAASDNYYTLADNADQLKQYFANVVENITTKVQIDIILHEDTILRDIMGQGLILTPGTIITAYRVPGDFNYLTGNIDWARDTEGNYLLEYVASVDMSSGKLVSDELAWVTQADGTEKQIPYIQVYNYGSANPTDPLGADYHPHTVDVTGYDFSNWYIDEDHPDGYMMVVEITRIEAMDNVEWGRSTTTNHRQSGLWLPANAKGERELLLPFDQPTTLFVERAYVLDYGKPFTLADWYFDDDTTNSDNVADPIHIDTSIPNGMNWFDTAAAANGESLPTRYGNVTLADGQVTYAPTTMQWDGMDEFYVFGNTWRRTVLAQDANQNGNLWTKVQVIPANSVYYEDSFVTVEGENGLNGVDGFNFSGGWSTVFDGTDADNNGEIPEHLEQPPYGDVHGWIDAMVNEGKFSDGSAHFTNEVGAKAEFTFTGCGVDVYTRTNNNSGVVVATIYRLGYYDEDGNYVNDWKFYDGQIMDNLAVSGDYYHIPTISFMDLPHGTYRVELIATAATVANTDDQGNYISDGPIRNEYHIDGIRVYKPLSEEMEANSTITTAYENEVNSSFVEVRDVLIDNDNFNIDMEDSTDGTMGAVFIDWIRSWQGAGADQPGEGVPTYEVGTFEKYGPKNEVYLTSGQAIVLKVDPNNTYYVGLKSLDGTDTIANVSGITTADPVAIQLNHSIDLYYQVTPVDGYIVIQNGASNGSVLSVTKLRATNKERAVLRAGIQPVTQEEVVRVMAAFSRQLMMNHAGAETEEGLILPVDPIMESFREFLRTLFSDVRAWMKD